MAKTLSDYILLVQKDHEYKIKLAIELNEDHLNKLERLLMSKYVLIDVSDIHKTPFLKNPLDFPNLTNMEIYVIDIKTKYPASCGVLAEEIARALKIHPNVVRVYGEGNPYDEYVSQMEKNKEEPYVNRLMHPDHNEYKETNKDDIAGPSQAADMVDAVLRHSRENGVPKNGATGNADESMFLKALRAKQEKSPSVLGTHDFDLTLPAGRK